MTTIQSPHNPAPFPTLDVGRFDPYTDTIVIEGTKYAATFFRELGFSAQAGHILRIENRAEDGVLTVTRMHELEAKE